MANPRSIKLVLLELGKNRNRFPPPIVYKKFDELCPVNFSPILGRSGQ
jgi:hypothetical protein